MRRYLPSASSIRAFEAAARHGSFRAAADELGRVPSAISHQIKHLETMLGVTLFARIGNRRVLTKDGRIYAKAIDKAFDEISLVGEQLASQQVPKQLKISTSPAFMALGIVPNLRNFRIRNPDILLEFEVETGAGLAPRDDVDAFIQLESRHQDGYVAERLWHSKWLPVAAPAFASQLGKLGSRSDFTALPLIHYAIRPRLWCEWFAAHRPDSASPEPKIIIENGWTAFGLIESGLPGVMLGLFPLMSTLVQSGRLVRVRPEAISSPEDYYLSYRRALVDTPKIKIIRAWLRDIVGNQRSAGSR